MSEVSKSAKVLSQAGSSAGGRARASRLTAEERSAIARDAAKARWGSSIAVATHSGELVIGGQSIACAVLEDGTRVINQGTLLSALGRARKAKTDSTGTVLFAGNLSNFVPAEVREAIESPISYAPQSGGRATGYPAGLLPQICEVYLSARSEGALLKSQEPAARAAEILVRGLAKVGIVALVDEATGYQETRARHELEAILDAYVQSELRPWVRRFPDEFFRQIYRLQGWEYKPGTSKRTPYVGKLVNKYVYEQLPPGVLEQLEIQNPRNERGNRARKHHQFLTADTGNSHLDRQISTVTTLMRISDTQQQFIELFERAFPPPQGHLPLVVEVPDE